MRDAGIRVQREPPAGENLSRYGLVSHLNTRLHQHRAVYYSSHVRAQQIAAQTENSESIFASPDGPVVPRVTNVPAGSRTLKALFQCSRPHRAQPGDDMFDTSFIVMRGHFR